MPKYRHHLLPQTRAWTCATCGYVSMLTYREAMRDPFCKACGSRAVTPPPKPRKSTGKGAAHYADDE